MSGMPTLTDSGQRLYDAVETLAQKDAQYGYPLASFCASLAAMVDPVATIVRDPDEGSSAVPGWAVLFDVDNVPASWLPWLAQFVGVNLSAVTDAASQRALIKEPAGYERCMTATMRAVAQQTLTGTKTVLISERAGNDGFKVNVSTYTSETSNPAATLAALLSQKPAGVVMDYTLVTGGTYSQLAASHAQYTQMEAAHSTYSDIPANPGA